MTNVRVLLFAAYREVFGTNSTDVEVPEGATAEDVFDRLCEAAPRLAALRPFTRFAVNRRMVDPDFEVHEGDELAFIQPVSGGAMIELLHEPLSVERCLEAVRGPENGGIASFVGCVRDVSDGKRVEFLEYEAYEPMALDALRQVIEEAQQRWPIRSIAIQHRLGRLEIGDDAVAIAVACRHRSEAFEACRYVIDRLKEVVPIWKKEHGEGGEVWVGGPTVPASSPSPDPVPD